MDAGKLQNNNPLYPILSCLEDREMIAIVMRYGLNDELPSTLEAIGMAIGNVRRERARQIINKALRKLRNWKRLDAINEIIGEDFKRFDCIEAPSLKIHRKPQKKRKRRSRQEIFPEFYKAYPSANGSVKVSHPWRNTVFRLIYKSEIVAPVNKHGDKWMDACKHVGHYSYYHEGVTRQLLMPKEKKSQVLNAMLKRGYHHLLGSFWGVPNGRVIAIGEHRYGLVPKAWVNSIDMKAFRSLQTAR